ALPVSALAVEGLAQAWDEMRTLIAWRKENGHWDRTRAAQARHWFEAEVRDGLLSALSREPQRGLMTSLGDRVAQGDLAPEAAAAEMLRLLGRPA
ncbi:MAG TPA: methylmalonyl Co-A mutase-associated GTPase MeaB, partial [Tabrizicola sp.]